MYVGCLTSFTVAKKLRIAERGRTQVHACEVHHTIRWQIEILPRRLVVRISMLLSQRKADAAQRARGPIEIRVEEFVISRREIPVEVAIAVEFV